MKQRLIYATLNARILGRTSTGFAKKCYSSKATRTPLRFSYVHPAGSKIDTQVIFNKLRNSEALNNQHEHDSAVVLVTPDLARTITEDGFLAQLAKLLGNSSQDSTFNLLGAVVDQIAPTGASTDAHLGLSIVRGSRTDILPDLWQPNSDQIRQDTDTISALTFELGKSSITAPLARTTFHNHKHSTLLAASIDLSGDIPTVQQIIEKQWQHIKLSTESTSPTSTGSLGLWAPLVPITIARKVTDSFGNIIRGIEIDGESSPASSELETAVDTVFRRISTPNIDASPIGVWALVTPPSVRAAFDYNELLREDGDIENLATSTASQMKDLLSSGAQLFKILSGGGGWGVKKGLLSLDPQQTHFPLSDEEEMQKFMSTMQQSSFAPIGSTIQFFVAPPKAPRRSVALSGDLFGISGGQTTLDMQAARNEARSDAEHSGHIVEHHFGALSHNAIFVNSATNKERLAARKTDDIKLTVPNSLVYLQE